MNKLWIVGLVLALGLAAYFGLKSEPTPPKLPVIAEGPRELGRSPRGVEPQVPAGHPDMGQTALPPNHPPVNGDMGADPHGAASLAPLAGDGGAPPAAEEDAEGRLTWTAPATWKAAENPSPMRLATFRVGADAELSVSRAGGSVDANAERWAGQLGATAKVARSVRTVRGLKVNVVDVQTEDRALLGAIVETAGTAHFFKLTGPAKTVRAAQAEFDSFIASLTPKTAK